MPDGKIIISNHVLERFVKRKIKFTSNKYWKYTISQQIKHDLRPLNIREIIKINDTERKIITNQGKVYITKEFGSKRKVIVKTVYKIDLRDTLLN